MCIICGGRAGSGEHIFPAALGGRRINNGIYCKKHNEGFSPLVAILSGQLNSINALLGVRPDRSDQPRQLTATNPSDGQAYLVSATNIELASPRFVNDSTVEGVRHVAAQFANERQIREWLTEQRAAGFKVEIQKREEGRGYFSRPYKVELELGRLEGLRAIGYITLTFLAHYFPPVARQPELRAFKDFALGASDKQPVWWDFTAPPDDIPPNSFRFGHRILIGLSAARQEAYARVSLFSTLDFAIHFGAMRVASSQTVIVDIDPQADRAPGDISEIREQKALAAVDRPESLTSSLRDTIESGDGRMRFERLLQNISDWHRECVAKELLPKIEATKSLNAYERIQQVKHLLSDHGQSVFNLMLFVARGCKEQFGADPATAALVPAVDILVAEAPGSATGISQTAACTLELATTALSDQICRDQTDGKLNWERLSLLLGGRPGAEIVAKVMLQPLMMALGITQ